MLKQTYHIMLYTLKSPICQSYMYKYITCNISETLMKLSNNSIDNLPDCDPYLN